MHFSKACFASIHRRAKLLAYIAIVLVSLVRSTDTFAQGAWDGGAITFDIEPSGLWTLRWTSDPVVGYTGGKPGPMDLKVYADCDVNRGLVFGRSGNFPFQTQSDDLVMSFTDVIGGYQGESPDYESLCFHLETGRGSVSAVSQPGILEVTKTDIEALKPNYYITGYAGYRQNLNGQPKYLGTNDAGALVVRGSPFTRQTLRGSYWPVGTPDAGKELALIIEKEAGNDCPGNFSTRRETDGFAAWAADLNGIAYYPRGSCIFEAKIYQVPEDTASADLATVVAPLTPVYAQKIDIGTDTVELSAYGECGVVQVLTPEIRAENGSISKRATFAAQWYKMSPASHTSTGCPTGTPTGNGIIGAGDYVFEDPWPSGSFIRSGQFGSCAVDDPAKTTVESTLYEFGGEPRVGGACRYPSGGTPARAGYFDADGAGFGTWFFWPTYTTATPEFVDTKIYPGLVTVLGIPQLVTINSPGADKTALNGLTERRVTFSSEGPGAVTLSIKDAGNIAGCSIDQDGLITTTGTGACTVVASKAATTWYEAAEEELVLNYSSEASSGNEPTPIIPTVALGWDGTDWQANVSWTAPALSDNSLTLDHYDVYVTEGGNTKSCQLAANVTEKDLLTLDSTCAVMSPGGTPLIGTDKVYTIAVTATDSATVESTKFPIGLCWPTASGSACELPSPILRGMVDDDGGYLVADYVPLASGTELGDLDQRYRLFLGHPTEARSYDFFDNATGASFTEVVSAGGRELVSANAKDASSGADVDPYDIPTTSTLSPGNKFRLSAQKVNLQNAQLGVQALGVLAGETYDFFVKSDLGGNLASNTVPYVTSYDVVTPPTVVTQTVNGINVAFHVDTESGYPITTNGSGNNVEKVSQGSIYEIEISTNGATWVDVSPSSSDYADQIENATVNFADESRACSSQKLCFGWPLTYEEMASALSIESLLPTDTYFVRMRAAHTASSQPFWSPWTAPLSVPVSYQTFNDVAIVSQCSFPYGSECRASPNGFAVAPYACRFPVLITDGNACRDAYGNTAIGHDMLVPLELSFTRGLPSSLPKSNVVWEWSRNSGANWNELSSSNVKCDGDDTNSAGIASICTVVAPGTGGPTAIPPQGVYVPAEDLAGVAGFTDNIAIRAGFKDPITSDVSYGIAVESGDIKLVTSPSEPTLTASSVAGCSATLEWDAPAYTGGLGTDELSYEISYSDQFGSSEAVELTFDQVLAEFDYGGVGAFCDFSGGYPPVCDEAAFEAALGPRPGLPSFTGPSLVKTVSARTAVVAGLKPNSRYLFQINAKNEAGTTPSDRLKRDRPSFNQDRTFNGWIASGPFVELSTTTCESPPAGGFGTPALDTDGDGVSDALEADKGTDPQDASSVPDFAPTLPASAGTPAASSGEAAYIFNDGTKDPTPLTIVDETTLRAGDEGDFQMDLAGNEEGAARVDEIRQTLVFNTGKEGIASGRGFQPGSPAEIWLFSNPTFLGATTVESDGTFTKTFIVPADTPLGEHVVQAEGISVDGSPRAVAAGVFVSSLGADADGDGVSDADEIAAGSDPFDAEPATTFAVTPSAGAGGSISPSAVQTVAESSTTSFTVTPDSGYEVSGVGGTCGGSLSGNAYTTSQIASNCTVVASFEASSVPTAEPVPLGSALLRALMFFGIALLAILSLRRRMAL